MIHDLLEKVEAEGNVVIIPGAYQADYIDEINKELNKLESAVVMVMSDEESQFPVDKLDHPNMKVWVQYPKNPVVGGRYLPAGYSPNASYLIRHLRPKAKNLDWIFAGQVTHESRRQCVAQLRQLEGGFLLESEGFTQGLDREEYLKLLSHAKIAVCPNGTVVPDTLRLYEALEAGCIPIVESAPYFEALLGDFPFPVVYDWVALPSTIETWKDNELLANQCRKWWESYKLGLIKDIEDDLWTLI